VAVGDSVLLSAAGELERLLGHMDVDAVVGRQPAAGIDALRKRYNAGQLGSVVIVHLGNNGPFTTRQIDEIMGMLVDVRQVILVNCKVPRQWEGPNNARLAEKARQYPNVLLVDWYAASHARPELFYSDGVHLRPEGTTEYAALIAAIFAEP
jgi:hypothetical protein